MFRVNSCCCGCTLKTGAIIIGSLEAAGGILVNTILLIILIPEMTDTKFANTDKFNEENVDMIIGIISNAIGIIFGILLIVGAVKAKTTFLRAWIFYTIATCFLGIIGFLVVAVTVSAVDGFLGILFFVDFHIYLLIVVNSLYLEIKESGMTVVYKASESLQSV